MPAASHRLTARLKAWARAIRRDGHALWLAARDRRTPWAARLLALAIAAYALSPIDLIPDFIPFIGEVDDVFLLVIALQRLVANAGRPVLLAHWTGAIEDLADLNLKEALAAAAFFLPRGIRRKLKLIGRG